MSGSASEPSAAEFAATSAGPTGHAVERYEPEAAASRKGIALCLSGGGFRAALFHLGAIRRLNELGVLSKVTTISSVSGGSILAAHLAERLHPWPQPGETFSDWEAQVAAPFRAFTATNIRTWPILKRLFPWNWLRTSTGVEGLVAAYQQSLTRRPLRDLPDRPQFIFCATDMAFGVNWIFSKDRMGDYQVGYATPPDDFPLAKAVAASSCFPPVFNPLPIHVEPSQLRGGRFRQGDERNRILAGLRLTDGGNYDNLGLEPVWKSHAVLLVSDGGSTFDFEPDANLIWRLSRYTAIVANQVDALRKRWLISNFNADTLAGTYWGIGSNVARYEVPGAVGYSSDIVDEVISEVRTDLDAFAETEAEILENHGYLLADVAIRRHATALLPTSAPAAEIPHPQWTDDSRIRAALRTSHKRKLPLGRW